MNLRQKEAKKRCRPCFKIAHNCSRIRSEDHFLYANFNAPPTLWLVPPHFICSGGGTASGHNILVTILKAK